jgi:hypothetical protein
MVFYMKIRHLHKQSGKQIGQKGGKGNAKQTEAKETTAWGRRGKRGKAISGRTALLRQQVALKGHGLSAGGAEYPGRGIGLLLGVGGGWLG